MLLIPSYSMLSATMTTLMLSAIFLLLSYQSNKNYMRFWGVSWLLYSAMFFLDFLNLQVDIQTEIYVMFRQMIALIGSYVFLVGTHYFFQIKTPRTLFWCTCFSVFLTILYAFSHLIYTLALIPNIIYCSGILIFSGCMFISYSWTQNLPEKILAGFFIIVWGIFINHFGFSIKHIDMAIFTYFISIFTVNILILFLMIIYFKKTRFLDRKQASRYRLLVENSADSMFLYDYKTSTFEYVSPTISELIGVTDRQLYQQPSLFYAYVSILEQHKTASDLFSKPIVSPGQGLLQFQKSGATEKWSEIHYIPIRDATGSTIAVEGILRDVTEQKKMEEDLKEVENAKKELLENISHEIKTPVTLIQGYAESLLDRIVPVESTETYLHMINSKAMMLNTLVDDLAQVSKLSSQSLEYQFYEKNAVDVFSELISQFEFQIIESNHVAKVSSTILLNTILIVDPYRIQQVISNLVNNSIRHTPEGGEITISCVTHINHTLSRSVPEDDDYTIPEGELIFTVRDSGDGVPEQDLPRIFERNFSTSSRKNLDTSDPSYQNPLPLGPQSGLGLFISMQIIKQHSGNIWARNNPEGGLEVSFSLPCYY